MIPRIIFRYSQVYDLRYRESPIILNKLKSQKKIYPSIRKISQYAEEIEPKWHKIEKKVLKEISKMLGLSWKENKIICYIVGFCKSFSDPLTIRLFPSKDEFMDTLIHELIHQIQSQNQIINQKWRIYLKKNYKKESIMTQNHLVVHAIHHEIYLKMFNKKRLNKEIKNSSLDYKRSWEIVLKETPKAIIKKFKEVAR